jgi:hypothetical protein
MQFKDVLINGIFNLGYSYGMGICKNEKHETIYKKKSPSLAIVVECKWAPRQLGTVSKINSNRRVWI